MNRRIDDHVSEHRPSLIYPEPTAGLGSSAKTYSPPAAELAKALHDQHMNANVATRLPKLRLSAWILIGIMAFSAAQALLLRGVFIGVAGAEGLTNALFAPLTIATWIAGVAIGCILLRTKDVVLARRIVAGVCLLFVYWIVTSLITLDIVGATIDGFLLWWTYDLYRALDAFSYSGASAKHRA